jgi:hypothetical protein
MTKLVTRLLILAIAAGVALFGQTRRNAYVLPGDTVIPRIDTGQTGSANDGTPIGTYMTFQILNISGGPASLQMSFKGLDGSPLALNFELCDNDLAAGLTGSCFSPLGNDGLPTDEDAIDNGTFLLDVLPVGGVAFARTFINGPRTFGYATIQAQPAGAIAVSANFNQLAANPDGSLRPLFAASVPLSTSVQQKFFAPALNAGSTAALGVVSIAGGEVNLRALNSDGAELCTNSIDTTVGEAFANTVAALLPCTANRESMVEVTGEALAGVAYTFFAESFATQPVYGPVPAPVL